MSPLSQHSTDLEFSTDSHSREMVGSISGVMEIQCSDGTRILRKHSAKRKFAC